MVRCHGCRWSSHGIHREKANYSMLQNMFDRERQKPNGHYRAMIQQPRRHVAKTGKGTSDYDSTPLSYIFIFASLAPESRHEIFKAQFGNQNHEARDDPGTSKLQCEKSAAIEHDSSSRYFGNRWKHLLGSPPPAWRRVRRRDLLCSHCKLVKLYSMRAYQGALSSQKILIAKS